ncbi:hypothetical protein [Paenibacillus wynnii]|uniref:Uncharacterized protein n=1 Tax=Paenibacillus wynnii TaxID=268407 RepID=A0A098M8F6_9BACL|nr:hypothetical protein [Paenibacillus wynnii]KGE18341.1 hypothetical protein PWYN_27910 [Paenibacillus wynnii]
MIRYGGHDEHNGHDRHDRHDRVCWHDKHVGWEHWLSTSVELTAIEGICPLYWRISAYFPDASVK